MDSSAIWHVPVILGVVSTICISNRNQIRNTKKFEMITAFPTSLIIHYYHGLEYEVTDKSNPTLVTQYVPVSFA